MARFICIDIGGTSIKYGVYEDDTRRFVNHDSTPTQAAFGGPHIVETVRGIIQDLRRQSPVLQGICISTAGMVDVEAGCVRYASELIPQYTGTAWKALLEEETGLPCEVENDVNCAGLAEYHAGSAKGASSALCLTVGTGIGGAYIEHGRVLHGVSGSACEVGYLHLPQGDFQDLASTSALVKRVSGSVSSNAGATLSGRIIFERARSGDLQCVRAIDEMCDWLGMGIADICYVLNPEVVVLGGGIMSQQDYLYGRIRKSLDAHLRAPIAAATTLRFAFNQNRAGMLGAYYHFLDMQRNRS